jgi:NDP-sugar pyrophosphorylase family protein
MAFQQDDISVSHQLIVGEGFPMFLGVGPAKIRGASYIEGPAVIGDSNAFPNIAATLMVGPNQNVDSSSPVIPGALCGRNYSPYSFAVSGDAVIFDNLSVNKNIDAGANIIAQGEVMSSCGGHVLSAKKNFDIPHPSKEGWRLRYTCPEAPYNDVYIRGKLKNSNEISLPDYWKDFVDISSITVSITEIGVHQGIIVKTINENKIVLQSKGVLPINCFYHVFAERKDGEKLISEYEGVSPKDYPGNNDEYSIVGFNYDRRD